MASFYSSQPSPSDHLYHIWQNSNVNVQNSSLKCTLDLRLDFRFLSVQVCFVSTHSNREEFSELWQQRPYFAFHVSRQKKNNKTCRILVRQHGDGVLHHLVMCLKLPCSGHETCIVVFPVVHRYLTAFVVMGDLSLWCQIHKTRTTYRLRNNAKFKKKR